MTTEDFTRFLELLSSTGGEDRVGHYLRLYRRLEGFFTVRGVCDPTGATDATIDVAVRKIVEGTPVPDVGKYCMGIARNIVKERLRGERRELKAFIGYIENRDGGSGEEVVRIDEVLKPCFELLTAEDQELLRDYCRDLRGRARAEHRRELAARMNTTVQGLRMQVTRLRKELTDCAKRRPNDG
jgi:hypothetical protein